MAIDDFKKERELLPLKETLSAVFATKQWRNQWQLFQLVRDWPRIAGTQVAQLTTPAYFRKDVLWIFVQDSSWMQHLQYAKIDLLGKINQAVGEQTAVADLRWLMQPLSHVDGKRPAVASHPVDPEKERVFSQLIGGVSHQECRDALQRLWKAFASHEKEG